MNKLKYTCVFVTLIFVQISFAQKYSFINYNTLTGLPSNEIRGIYQTQKGALFVTTTAGISIFDGYRFKNFGYQDNIQYDYVKNFAELDNSTMYLFGNSGKEAYIFKDYIYTKSFKTPNIVTQYFTNKKNKGFVCTDNGLFQLTDTTFTKIEITSDSSRAANAYYKYLQANDSIALVLRTFPKNRFDVLHTKKKKIIYTKPELFGFHFLKDSRNRIWICTNIGIIKLKDNEPFHLADSNMLNNTPSQLDYLKGIQINFAVEDKKGNIWLATSGKGIVKVGIDGTYQNITKENGLLSNTIFRIFVDREDNLWIGTESGLQRMQEKQMIQYDKSTGLPENAVLNAIAIDSTRIIASTAYHISIINHQTHKIVNFPTPQKNEGYIIRFLKNNDNVYALTTKRILKINANNTNPITEITPPVDELMKDFYQRKDGTLIVITNSKVIGYKSNKPIILKDSLAHTARAIAEDNSNHLWIGTNKGMYVYKIITNNNFIKLLPIVEGFVFNGVFQIRFLQKDNEGNMWAATNEKGLFQLALKENKLIVLNNFTRKNGLSNDNVRHLFFSNDSTLICGTISGIDKIKLNKSEVQKTQISKITQLPDNSFAIQRDFTGKMLLIPFVEGLIIYPQADGAENPKMQKTEFTECYVNGKEYANFSAGKRINFLPDENNILFYFSSYTYSNTPYHFSYWLDDGDGEKWVQLNARNYVQFNNLSHGHYTLHIKTIGENNKQILDIISQKFVVQPLWYQTKIFRSITALSAGFLLFFFIRRRIKYIQKNAALKQKITETEMAALKAQMNPHFMFNCINSIDAFIHSNDKYNATLYLNKFAKLLRNILDSSKQNTVALTKDIETLKLYIELEELRHENKFKSIITIEEELLTNDYKVPPLIIQPFVENAILHGLKNKEGNYGLLQVTIKKAGRTIQYSISDNGIGREAASKIIQNKESSYGMTISYDRIKLFNKEKTPSVAISDLYNESGNANGTLVIVNLKLV